jgi:SAM-dependent methyltransferase
LAASVDGSAAPARRYAGSIGCVQTGLPARASPCWTWRRAGPIWHGRSRRRGEPGGNQPRFVCADIHAAPFRDGTFDYVTCALFFHHLTDDEVVRTLHAFDRVARRGIVVNDLIRRRRLFFWSWLLTRPFNAVLRQDGPLSVRRSFRPDELTGLAQRAGLRWLFVQTHFGHRMTLAGERPTDES